MKNRTRRIMNYRFDCYEETEKKLEKFAAKGLFLESCGSFFWTFRKGDPQKLKYTVTYFSEGSEFNPDITDNQQTYFDFANAAGWEFVTQFSQMQIFSSVVDHPIPFETDEQEKLENIKSCMNKSFLPSVIIMILVFGFNLFAQFNSFQRNPIDFMSNSVQLFPAFIFTVLFLNQVYALLNYFSWYKRSEKSIAMGGTCAPRRKDFQKVGEILFMLFMFGTLSYFLLNLASHITWLSLGVSIAQVPIMILIFRLSINYWKKKKVSARKNKVISVLVLAIAHFTYLALLMIFIMQYGFSMREDSNYRTVEWQLSMTESHEYRLYQDEIPLTSEDLYGPIDYDYYSYEAEKAQTIFLSKKVYRQDSPPAKDAPPRIEYVLLETQFDFVYQLAKTHLLQIPEWRDKMTFRAMDNKIFNTLEAYQELYEDAPTGDYLLFFENKIIQLNTEEPLSIKQLLIVKEKLQL